MGLYIHGMKLPPKGKVKMLVLFDDGVLLDNADGQNQWMAIELPPHGRLIDADALKNKHHWTDDFYETEYVEVEDIDAAPTIIPAAPEGGADG